VVTGGTPGASFLIAHRVMSLVLQAEFQVALFGPDKVGCSLPEP